MSKCRRATQKEQVKRNREKQNNITFINADSKFRNLFTGGLSPKFHIDTDIIIHSILQDKRFTSLPVRLYYICLWQDFSNESGGCLVRSS